MKDFKPVLKNKQFVYIWLSQILSQLTINIMNFVVLTRLFEITGSTIATSLLWVAYALPVVLVGPFAYTIVDLVDRRKLLIFTNLLQAATIFLYSFSHRPSYFLMYGVVILYSLINQFYVPSEQATIPTVLSKKELHFGNSLFFLTQQGALILGYGIAGFLLKLLGFTWTLYLSAFLVFMAFVSTLFLKEMKTEKLLPSNFEKGLEDFFSRILEGYRFIKNNRYILTPFIILSVLQICLTIVIVNVPIVAKDILGVPLDLAGISLIVPAGVGAALGAIFIPKLIRKGYRKKQLIEYSLLTISIILFILVIFTPLLSGYLRFLLTFTIIIFGGLAYVGITIPTQTFLQEVTPGGMRGRIFGNFWFLITLATIFPTIFSGTITEVFGIRSLFLILVVGAFAGYLLSKNWGDRFLNGKILNHEQNI
jgi:MFS family permease